VKIIAIFYPETKGRSLEEMDSLFRRLSMDTEHQQVVNKSPQDDTPDGEEQVAEEAVTHLGKN
jgi:hypothetical protein